MTGSSTTRAVIFDMDGVLLDSEPLHYRALRDVLAGEGHEWTEKDNERLLGTTVADTFRIISQTVDLVRSHDDLIDTYNTKVLAILNGPLEPAPGLLPLLDLLRAHGVPIAVASSSLRDWIAATLGSLRIRAYFSIVVSGEEIENGKPSPDIYLRTADLLGVRPVHCAAIEDAPNGIASAHAAGMRVIAVRTPYTMDLSLDAADCIADALADIDLAMLHISK